jgi:SAM-dependent methyltransferase
MRSPLTGTENVSRLATFSPNEIAARWRERWNIEVGSSFEAIPRIELWSCHDTGLRWYEPPEAEGGAELYSQLENLEWYYMREKWEFDLARNLVGSSTRVLEVGVGNGFFLETCRSNELEVVGVEINPTAAKKVKDKGFQVFEDDLEQLAERLGEEYFDAICSFQVLEHVARPREFLSGMLRNLKVGGRLVLSVPNAGVMRRVDPENRDLLNQPPHHVSHWDEGVFRSLEDYLPVHLCSVHREPLAPYHVSWIVPSFLRNQFAFLGAPLNRILFNKISLFPVHQLLRLGLNKWFPGHTILVVLEKVREGESPSS